MTLRSHFLYNPIGGDTLDLAVFEAQATAPSLVSPNSRLHSYHQGLGEPLTMNYSASHDFDTSSRLSSSSSPNPSVAARRRQSSCVTAISSRSLGSDSQSSTGQRGTPESRASGKTTTPENAWPALNPKPSRQEEGGSSFNPIQNSYKLPPRRPRRPSSKPKPEMSKEDKEAKKSHSREKNKDAADRARRKKKKYASELEESTSELENKNSTLKRELESLTEEAARIRAELVGHSNCHDTSIGQWFDNDITQYLDNDAASYIQEASLVHPTIQAGPTYAAASSTYLEAAFPQESPSPPGYSDTVYQHDAGYTHSPGMYGDDQDPSFVTEMQASMLADTAFASDLLQDQYLDYNGDLMYPPMPDGSYQ
ncbi:cyclic AMP-dependent transcription factor ATF-2 [Microdochium nivale]|nr:cyclic AMP-dependent transcription factor ATF-2 [Microdochium nivale]